MDLIEVDVVEPHAREAGFHGSHDVTARQADVVRARPGSATHLGGDDQVFTLDLEIPRRLSEDALGMAFSIDIRGVDEIHAGGERTFDQLGGAGLIDLAPDLPSALAAEGRRSQADFRDIEAGAAERAMFHVLLPRIDSCRFFVTPSDRCATERAGIVTTGA